MSTGGQRSAGLRRIYADHAATTPLRPEALEAYGLASTGAAYNASSQHAEGRRARAVLDDARERVARALGAAPREIVFTSGGSESDAIAIVGAARAAARGRKLSAPRVVTTAIEHRAVLDTVVALEREGFAVTVLPVDPAGRVDPAAFAGALVDETVLASVALVNNELGTVAPVAQLAALARQRGVLFHTDAVQAPGRVPVDVRALGVDLLALTGHKFYGPKGVGLLYVRAGTPLEPLALGGGQEFGLRPGTENVAGIAAFARALELAVTELPAEAPRLAALRARYEAELAQALPGTVVHAAHAQRAPHVSSVAIPGVDAGMLAVALDLAGVAISAGSACAAGSTEVSHVLAALDIPTAQRRATVRFSFGHATQPDDVSRILAILPEIVTRIRDDALEVGHT